MKFLEKIFPAWLKVNPLVYNLSVIIACVVIFIFLFFLGAVLSIFLAFLIDTLLKKRGYNLEMATMALILILIALAVIADFIFCVVLLFTNLKW
jgi:hypothetical protein